MIAGLIRFANDLRGNYRFVPTVHRGGVPMHAWPAEALEEDAAAALHGTVAVGSRRIATQQMRLLIDEPVEIAACALSPGGNDRYTADSCLDWLGATLARYASAAMIAEHHFLAAVGDVGLSCDVPEPIAVLRRRRGFGDWWRDTA